MHSCKPLLLALCFIAAASATHSDCFVSIDDHMFDLCAFKDPIVVPFDVFPDSDVIEFSFSPALQNVPNCNNGTPNAWMKIFAPDSQECIDFGAGIPSLPLYSLSEQKIGLHILTITYALDGKNKFEVNLYCNPKGKRTTKIDFFVSSLETDTFTFYGYSIYGCPVPTSSDGFLSVKQTQL